MELKFTSQQLKPLFAISTLNAGSNKIESGNLKKHYFLKTEILKPYKVINLRFHRQKDNRNNLWLRRKPN